MLDRRVASPVQNGGLVPTISLGGDRPAYLLDD
jgi:hypothetical protein